MGEIKIKTSFILLFRSFAVTLTVVEVEAAFGKIKIKTSFILLFRSFAVTLHPNNRLYNGREKV
jgi:hypothetical protein